MIKLFNQYVLIEIIDTNMFTERLLPDSNISNRVFGRIWNTLFEDERCIERKHKRIYSRKPFFLSTFCVTK